MFVREQQLRQVKELMNLENTDTVLIVLKDSITIKDINNINNKMYLQ